MGKDDREGRRCQHDEELRRQEKLRTSQPLDHPNSASLVETSMTIASRPPMLSYRARTVPEIPPFDDVMPRAEDYVGGVRDVWMELAAPRCRRWMVTLADSSK